MTRSGLGIRATINARLEEVSFRTGMTAGAVTLLGLAAVAAAAMMTVMPSHGKPLNGAAVAPTTASSPVTIAAVPVAARTSRTPAPKHPKVSSTPAGAGQSATQATDPSPDYGSGSQYGSSDRQYGSGGGYYGHSRSGQYGHGGQQGYGGGYGSGGGYGGSGGYGLGGGQSGYGGYPGGY